LATEEVADELHAVADAEHGDTQLEDLGVDRGRAVLEDARGTAGEDDRRGLQRLDGGDAHRARVDLTVDAELADAPGDELRVLAAEVEDEDGCAGHFGPHIPRAPRPCERSSRAAEEARLGDALPLADGG